MKKNNNESMDAYHRTIQINQEYGFTPGKPVYGVTGDDCYGVYDDYAKLKRDTKNANVSIVRDDTLTTWKVMQKCYATVIRNTWPKYTYKPISHANEMVFLQPVGKLFERV